PKAVISTKPGGPLFSPYCDQETSPLPLTMGCKVTVPRWVSKDSDESDFAIPSARRSTALARSAAPSRRQNALSPEGNDSILVIASAAGVASSRRTRTPASDACAESAAVIQSPSLNW